MSAEEFSLRLHGLITRKYKTVKDFAAGAHINYSSIEGYVNGHHEPSLSKLVAIRNALGCSWDELLEGR